MPPHTGSIVRFALAFAACLATAATTAIAQEWCDTHIVWAKRAGAAAGPPLRGFCPTLGLCDDPLVRDASVPPPDGLFKPVHLHFVVLREDDGTNPAATESYIAFQLAQLNADYAPHRIHFVAGYHWVDSSEYRSLIEAEVDPMKQAHAREPGRRCNIFVTDLSGIGGGLLGRAIFPWDPAALSDTGGIIIDEGAFGMGQKTLTHEMGHIVGLWHTHRGVVEFYDDAGQLLPCALDGDPCDCDCYERADGVQGDITGDFASDTPPTPVNFTCNPPGGDDPCSATPWGATQPENYMGYAPDSCYSMFTGQQSGRMNCWINSNLRGWYAGSWGGELKRVASDGSAADRFGLAVAISDDIAVVGAYLDDLPGAFNCGSAYVFERAADGTWVEQAKLNASDAAGDDNFGISVAVSAETDTIVIGAHMDDHGPTMSNAGSAYVFVRTAGVWAQQAKLVASDGAATDFFGWRVGVSGDTAIIGAYFNDQVAFNAGAAYVFERIGGAWSEQQKLTASDGAGADAFGFSVAISGDTAIVGAYLHDLPGLLNAGAAYVFTRTFGIWSEEQKLTAPDAATTDFFGYSVAVSADTVAVASPLDDVSFGFDHGAVNVFVRSAGVWSHQTRLTASDAAPGDTFGQQVGISADALTVGAFQDDHAGGADAGSAYVFMRADGAWSQHVELTASDAAADDRFGAAVALSGDTALVGAYFDDNAGGLDAGSAYFYRILPLCAGDINGDGQVDAGDVPLMVQALTVGALTPAQRLAADLDGNGVVDGDDISLFVDAVIAGAGC